MLGSCPASLGLPLLHIKTLEPNMYSETNISEKAVVADRTSKKIFGSSFLWQNNNLAVPNPDTATLILSYKIDFAYVISESYH